MAEFRTNNGILYLKPFLHERWVVWFHKSEQTHIASKLRNKLEHAAEENLEERREYPYDYSTWRKC